MRPYPVFQAVGCRWSAVFRCRTPGRWSQTWGSQRTGAGRSAAVEPWPSLWTSGRSADLRRNSLKTKTRWAQSAGRQTRILLFHEVETSSQLTLRSHSSYLQLHQLTLVLFFFLNSQQQTDPETKRLVYSDAFTVLDKVGFQRQQCDELNHKHLSLFDVQKSCEIYLQTY